MTVQASGITHQANLFDGPIELQRRGLGLLGAVVLFTTVFAPLARLLGIIYVLLVLRFARPLYHLRTIFRCTTWLAPWAMADVLLVGAFVAFVKLQNVVQMQIGTALLTLGALVFTMTWLEATLDVDAIWVTLDYRDHSSASHATEMVSLQTTISCSRCGLVNDAATQNCKRCGGFLSSRKPDSLARTWALVIAGAVLYIPANNYPVLTVLQLGAGQPSTILGGVRELIESKMYPLALLVFVASIAIPLLKLLGLSAMLLCTQFGAGLWLRERSQLYVIITKIGRWSMIDIFMESLLGALVQFGNLITIQPGVGAVAFCAVVILTILAAETFDPRLMWDAAARSCGVTQAESPANQATNLTIPD